MHKIHVTQTYRKDISTVFKRISNHEVFLSGGGLSCTLIKKGVDSINGVGAIRKIVSDKMTFEEEITEFIQNKSYAYVINSIDPKQSILHHKGWLEFKETKEGTQVDWYSNFDMTVPVIGKIIGFFVKRTMANAFLKRLKFIK